MFDLCKAHGLALDDYKTIQEDLVAQYDLDKVTWALPIWEKLLNIKTDETKLLKDRRSAIKARWRSDGKSDLILIQSIADSWQNGEVIVSFVDGKIRLNFNSSKGVPEDLHSLINAVSDVSPAHLAVIYILNYLLIKDVQDVMTLTQLQTQKISKFAF